MTDNDFDDYVADDSDLVYSGRARKRPPGAGGLIQDIYVMLYNHPEGMTLDEFYEEFRDGWLYTDDYRAYEQVRSKYRTVASQKGPAKQQYGSPEFKRNAQRWAITRALGSMVKTGTARREGERGYSRWYIGTGEGRRHPGPQIATNRAGLIYLDPAKAQAEEKAERERQLRRETLRTEARQIANDKRLGKSTRDFAQRVENYLAGR